MCLFGSNICFQDLISPGLKCLNNSLFQRRRPKWTEKAPPDDGPKAGRPPADHHWNCRALKGKSYSLFLLNSFFLISGRQNNPSQRPGQALRSRWSWRIKGSSHGRFGKTASSAVHWSQQQYQRYDRHR